MKTEMENNKEQFPSYLGVFYATNPAKFKRVDEKQKSRLFYAIAIASIVVVIFPSIIPASAFWVRTAGVILAIVFTYKGYMSGCDIVNINSGGKVEKLGLKKFMCSKDEADPIIYAFVNKDFAYLADLQGADSAPIQIHFEEDVKGREIYCLLTTFDSNSQFVGLADVITLSGNDFDKSEKIIRAMCKG